MDQQPRTPHLRSVPTPRSDETRVGSREHAAPMAGEVEAIGEAVAQAETARDGGSADPVEPVRFTRRQAGMRGLGQETVEEGFGTVAGIGGHLLTTTGAAGTGALVGGLASGTWSGAGIGALAHLTLLGLTAGLFGAGRLTTQTRMIYGVLALVAGAGTGWLVWRRMR